MRLVRYEHGGNTGIGVHVEGGVVPTGCQEMIEIIRAGEAGLEAARSAVAHGTVISSYRVLAPLTAPGKMLFSGVNYRSHIEENPGATLPTYPQIFAKLPSSIIGPGEPIVVPEPESQVDYEVELAVVIGKTAHKVMREHAREHIFGYTIVNDVSGRDTQFKDGQITTGKGFDTFCPLGPEIVLCDEIADPSELHLASYVNGERRQAAPAADMIFSIEELIEFLSRHITLYPGDVISTGTPAGVGMFRHPPLYLKPGDTVTVEVDAIGRLTNPVEAGW